jgi:hypothetical protein
MLMTYARVENGALMEQRVLKPGDAIPSGDWRPVVVEGLNYDLAAFQEVGRGTRIEAERVVRFPILEPLPFPTREEYGAAVEAHVDAVARSRGYAGAVSMISYESSSVPQYAVEAATMRTWRDSVWIAVGTTEAEVRAGLRPSPTISELIALLPPAPFA